MKYNVLVFPCGSEVALEIHRSLKYSTHVNLYGGNSVSDHGRFIFDNYIGDIPFYDREEFIPTLKEIVIKNKIDVIYPAMDSVIEILKSKEVELGCKVVASPYQTTRICLSKSLTYEKLKDIIDTPTLYDRTQAHTYPLFLKPDIGYGSRGARKVENIDELNTHLSEYPTSIILEYLSGREYTIDCFTNFEGDLLFSGARQRSRISNGISVNTSTMLDDRRFFEIAQKINKTLNFNGAWFFQVKERGNGDLVLLEIASRFGGSSAVYRMKGINFALLSIFNTFNINVKLIENAYEVEMDRALDLRFKSTLTYQKVYVDFDDVVIIDEKVNLELIKFLYKTIGEGKKIHLITKHKYNIHETLKKYRLESLFDEVIHLDSTDHKWKYMDPEESIFIDDSFAEREQVKEHLNIPVFSPDMITLLV